ncbi:mCG64840, partial [Mus musculus]
PVHKARTISNSSADDPGRMNHTPVSHTEAGLVLARARQKVFLIKVIQFKERPFYKDFQVLGWIRIHTFLKCSCTESAFQSKQCIV